MNSEEKPNPRHELEDLIEQQGGNSLENCHLEFLGYQQGLKGEMPRQDLAHLGAYKKGYLSARDYLHQQKLKNNPPSGNRQQDFLTKINEVEKDILPRLALQIKQQGLGDERNCQLELLGFQDGLANLKAQKDYWFSYAYQKGYITGTNRWSKKFFLRTDFLLSRDSLY